MAKWFVWEVDFAPFDSLETLNFLFVFGVFVCFLFARKLMPLEDECKFFFFCVFYP